ncbi:hypothetical protein ACI65C_005929 [Semiaphis heraclei]
MLVVIVDLTPAKTILIIYNYVIEVYFDTGIDNGFEELGQEDDWKTDDSDDGNRINEQLVGVLISGRSRAVFLKTLVAAGWCTLHWSSYLLATVETACSRLPETECPDHMFGVNHILLLQSVKNKKRLCKYSFTLKPVVRKYKNKIVTFSFFVDHVKLDNAMATISNESDSPQKNTSNEESDNIDDQDNVYECNICLDSATDAVVSVCGHLFCWPCLHQWLVTRPNCQLCPVCKAGINRDKVLISDRSRAVFLKTLVAAGWCTLHWSSYLLATVETACSRLPETECPDHMFGVNHILLLQSVKNKNRLCKYSFTLKPVVRKYKNKIVTFSFFVDHVKLDNAMATISNESDSPQKNTSNEESDNIDDQDNYECNICLDSATDAVVSVCGHLFCWPCLHQWLVTRPNCQLCPVCKAGINRDKVIPIYGRGNSKKEDPR